MRVTRAWLLIFLISAAWAAPAPQGFAFRSVSNRFVTPNGDGKNDSVQVAFDNPQVSQVTGKIYDSRGSVVASMTACPGAADCLMWDGASNGQAARAGIYVYVVQAEGKAFRGAVVVIR
jgi:gliding motility-associated-like protein